MEILRVLELQGSCSIQELATRLDVAQETIRRNVRPLAENGHVIQIRGAVLLPERMQQPAFHRRMSENREAKRRIARHVAARISDGDSMILDTGSTTAFIAQELVARSNLRVITNSAEIASILAPRNGNLVSMAGGDLRNHDGAAFGPAALAFIEQFEVHHAILSIGGFDAEKGLMVFDLCEAEFSRTVIRHAEHVIMAADHTKFGRRGYVRLFGMEEVDLFVTDASPPSPFREQLEAAEVDIAIAGDQ